MNAPVEIATKILLAEDDNDMRRFLVKALQTAGYDVASFDNGLSAYNRLREEPFELLLTDIVMPEMDGIELARRATELDPEIKVMFITGFAAVALNPDNNAPKDARILSKPFHLQGSGQRGRAVARRLTRATPDARPRRRRLNQANFLPARPARRVRALTWPAPPLSPRPPVSTRLNECQRGPNETKPAGAERPGRTRDRKLKT